MSKLVPFSGHVNKGVERKASLMAYSHVMDNLTHAHVAWAQEKKHDIPYDMVDLDFDIEDLAVKEFSATVYSEFLGERHKERCHAVISATIGNGFEASWEFMSRCESGVPHAKAAYASAIVSAMPPNALKTW